MTSLVGERITQLRQEKGLNQAEFAKKIEFDPSYVSKIENGKEPSYEFLKRAAKALSVPPSYLVATEAEINGMATYTTETSELLATLQQLSEEDRRSVADFLGYILERKRKRDAVQR